MVPRKAETSSRLRPLTGSLGRRHVIPDAATANPATRRTGGRKFHFSKKENCWAPLLPNSWVGGQRKEEEEETVEPTWLEGLRQVKLEGSEALLASWTTGDFRSIRRTSERRNPKWDPNGKWG